MLVKLLCVLEVAVRELGPHCDHQLAGKFLHELERVVNLLLSPITVFRVIDHLLEDAVELFLRSCFDLTFDLTLSKSIEV